MATYPNYFPVRCGTDELDTVSVLAAGLRAAAGRVLLDFEGDPWTGARIAAQVRHLQAWLREGGIRRGDRVAVMLRNSPEHVALIYALALAGIVWVPVNTRYRSASIAYLLDHSMPALLVCAPEFRQEAELARAQADHACPMAALPGESCAGEDADVEVAASRPSDTLCIIYTSGTTGAPKGVVFTHRMMRIACESALLVADVRAGDRLLLWEPLCHIGGAQMLLAPFLADAQLHLVPGFSASRFWQQVEASQATQLHYLGGILDILMRLPPGEQPATNPLRLAWGAGVSPQAWQPIIDRMGFALRECYGMTEGSSFATVNLAGRPGSIGKPLPWIRVELLGDDGAAVPVGETGQIVLSSDVEGIFLPGYLDDPDATARTLRGGKLYTGDMARQDRDGFLYFVGRRTDSIRVRGENVSAWEIERVFVQHPAVAAVAAVGVEGAIGEQEILLYVQFKPDAARSFPALAQWADQYLATFQRPRYYAAVESFQLTPSERIRKHLLPRDVAAAWDRHCPSGAAPLAETAGR